MRTKIMPTLLLAALMLALPGCAAKPGTTDLGNKSYQIVTTAEGGDANVKWNTEAEKACKGPYYQTASRSFDPKTGNASGKVVCP